MFANGSMYSNMGRSASRMAANSSMTSPEPDSASSLGLPRNLPLLLLQARDCLVAEFKPTLRERGLTVQQWRIMRCLLEQGTLEPREIGDRCQISGPSLAGVLSRMDRAGFIDRRPVLNDQRRLHVSLSKRGKRTALAAAVEIEAAYRSLQYLIGDEASQAMQSSLDALISALRSRRSP